MPIPARDIALGTRVPWFQVTAINGHQILTPECAKDPATGAWRPLLMMFLCNHSPYVRHIEQHLSAMIRECQAKGLYAIAVSPNDPVSYPSDDENHVREQIARTGFSFPYALDENQTLARAFEASCTPEFFLYGDMQRGGRLAYHGEYDATPLGHGQVATGAPLQAAIDAVLAGETFRDDQQLSFGCSVKWKSGQDATVALALS
jgi:hypothetical protein